MPASMIPPVYRRLSDGAYPIPAWHQPDPAAHVEVLMDDPPVVPAGWVAELAEQPDAGNILRYSLRELTAEEQAAARPIPREVTRLQARLALIEAGLWDAVTAYFNDPDTSLTLRTPAEMAFWEDAQTWRRDDPVIAAASTAIGLTDAQIDTLFRAAATR